MHVSTVCSRRSADLLDAAEPVLGRRTARASPSCAGALDGPLRVAIAGKVKAGKSTLLNALVGERVAPTDASECTRVVTWYRNSHVYRVTARAVRRRPGRAALPPHRPTRWRSTSAATAPTTSSTSTSSGRPSGCATTCSSTRPAWPRSPTTSRCAPQRFLASDEEGPGDADAVIYLLRHLHPTDLSFLEAFKDSIATPAPR